MLDTRFDRPLGDAGNVLSYSCPARIQVVAGAGSPDIVKDGRPDEALVAAFIAAAKELEAAGAIAITSTCGFLITIEREIAAAVSIPVIVSALSMYGGLKRKHGSGRMGIITASKAALGAAALDAAGIDAKDVVIAGMEGCEAFSRAILRAKDDQQPFIDQEAISLFIVEAAQAMCADYPDIEAILLECGNLPPYQPAISAAINMPVYSLLDGVEAILEHG